MPIALMTGVVLSTLIGFANAKGGKGTKGGGPHIIASGNGSGNSSEASKKAAIIVGIVAGCVVGVILLSFLYCYCRRRSQLRTAKIPDIEASNSRYSHQERYATVWNQNYQSTVAPAQATPRTDTLSSGSTSAKNSGFWQRIFSGRKDIPSLHDVRAEPKGLVPKLTLPKSPASAHVKLLAPSSPLTASSSGSFLDGWRTPVSSRSSLTLFEPHMSNLTPKSAPPSPR